VIAGEDLELFERSLRHATEAGSGAVLDASLRDLGWHDALAEDRRAAVSLLFELQGRAGTASGALDAVLLAALGLPGVDGGAAVVLPPLSSTDPPGRLAGGALEVRGVGTALASGASTLVVVAADDGGSGPCAAIVERSGLDVHAADGLDPALGLAEVTGSGVVVPSGTSSEAVPWADAVAVGQLALAHELVGASRAMLQLARDHAVERVQFDQPIARFQAVRHRLAEALVAIEAADGAAAAAWDDGATAFDARVAKALAGRSARIVARHAQQVLAGIGFTTEHPLHRYERRVLVLDRLLGDARSLSRTVGEELLAARTVPPVLPL
jgi:hypothetical protein